MHLNGFRSPAAPSPLARQRNHMTVCIWPCRHFLWYGTGCAGICVHHSLSFDECSQKSQGSFFLRGKGLCVVSQLSHFPSIPLGHCGALTGSLGCTGTGWFPVCSHLILGIFLVRGEAVHSKATGSVVWCWNSCETEIQKKFQLPKIPCFFASYIQWSQGKFVTSLQNLPSQRAKEDLISSKEILLKAYIE